MRLKLAGALALAVFILTLPRFAEAGSVQMGFLSDSSSFDDLRCGENVQLSSPGGESSCGRAKYGECSDCNSLVVVNRTDAPVKLHIKIIGTGFAQPCTGGAFGFGGNCPSGKSIRLGFENDCGNSLGPGKICTQPVEFCPEQAGESRGEVRVSVTAGAEPSKLTVFDVAGFGDYTPELAAADEARRSQLDALMKIPFVAKVELDTANHDIAINVEVTEDDKIDQIRRLVPPKIEGYRTEVTTYIPVGCGL